jgi:MYXO-CTERM domain-containing protein
MNHSPIIAAILTLSVLTACPAHAGCPNLCTLSDVTVSIQPKCPCISFSYTDIDCHCGVNVNMANGCSEAVSVMNCGYSFGTRDPVTPCPVLGYDEGAQVWLPMLPPDELNTTILLRSSSGDCTITVQASAEPVELGGCQCSVAGQRSSGSAGVASLLLGALLLGRRRHAARAS